MPASPLRVNGSRHFERNANKDIAFAFGQHKGERADEYPDYLRWMIRGDFPEEAKEVCQDLLDGLGASERDTRRGETEKERWRQ